MSLSQSQQQNISDEKQQSQLNIVDSPLNPEKLKCYKSATDAPYRFDTFDNSAREYLNSHGYVTIKNILIAILVSEIF